MKRLIPKSWRVTLISLLLARLTLKKLARQVDLTPARDNALVPDQEERSNDTVVV